MAGLLPSEGKLRGSPANILGDARARQNQSRVLFLQHRTRAVFYPRNSSRFIADETRHAHAMEQRATHEKPAIHAGLRDV